MPRKKDRRTNPAANPDYPAECKSDPIALLGGDARKYILDRCSPVDFLCDIVNGAAVREVYVNNQRVAKLPASMNDRMVVALSLTHKIIPDVKTIEARITEPDTKKVDVGKLSKKELEQLEHILTKSAS